MMKQILLFGAGKSATVLIDYFLNNAAKEGWQLTVVDANLELALYKIGNSPHGRAIAFDITDQAECRQYIQAADIVISMLPASLHYLVALECIESGKNLLTASYVDENIRKVEAGINEKGLLFLCEMGLDPGIDHMSAMQLINHIRRQGGHIHSFISHCGGLIAPESDNNPWHYKISWNPRNIVLAGKAGAHYREEGKEVTLSYQELFSTVRNADIPGLGALSWYANRDSLSYAPLYGLENAKTFVRTTLRHPDFMSGWNNIIELQLTDETPAYESDSRSLRDVFREHMDRHHFQEWLEKKVGERLANTQHMLESLVRMTKAEEQARTMGEEMPSSFMAAGAGGELEELSPGNIKAEAAGYIASQMQEANLALEQLLYLGMDDADTMVNKGQCSPADLLQLAVEKKLALEPGDRDMIVMLHEIGYEKEGQQLKARSSLVVKGEDHLRTAMAKTVGLPLGIAAKLILNGTIQLKGLHIPTVKEIYDPVLQELATHGIRFSEEQQLTG